MVILADCHVSHYTWQSNCPEENKPGSPGVYWGRSQLCRRLLLALARTNHVLVQQCSCTCHTILKSPGRAEQKGMGPAIVGATKGRSLSTFRRGISKCLAQFSEPACLSALVPKLWLKMSNEGRIRWMSLVPHRITQDECICTEEFCSIPNKHCLGGK